MQVRIGMGTFAKISRCTSNGIYANSWPTLTALTHRSEGGELYSSHSPDFRRIIGLVQVPSCQSTLVFVTLRRPRSR